MFFYKPGMDSYLPKAHARLKKIFDRMGFICEQIKLFTRFYGHHRVWVSLGYFFSLNLKGICFRDFRDRTLLYLFC